MLVAFIGCIAVVVGVLSNYDGWIKIGFALILTDLVLELANIHNTLTAIGHVIQNLREWIRK